MKLNREQLSEEVMENLHTIKNKIHVNFFERGSKECITPSQVFVLTAIKRDSGMGIKEISKKLHISPSATTQLVDCLVDIGCVTRKVDPDDRRALQINISAKGSKHIDTFKNKYKKISASLFRTLSDEELETYLELNKKILSNVLIKK